MPKILMYAIIHYAFSFVRTQTWILGPARGRTMAQEAHNNEFVKEWVKTLGFS